MTKRLGLLLLLAAVGALVWWWRVGVDSERRRVEAAALAADPFSGVAMPSQGNSVGAAAPILNPAALARATSTFQQQRGMSLPADVALSVTVLPDGRVGEVRQLGRALDAASLAALITSLQAQPLYSSASTRPPLRTVLELKLAS